MRPSAAGIVMVYARKHSPLCVIAIGGIDELLCPVAEALQAAGLAAMLEPVLTPAELEETLDRPGLDAVLYFHGSAKPSLTSCLKLAQDHTVDLPFLIITAPEAEAAALRALRSGAHDVITSDRLHRLAPSLLREVREARMRADHRAAMEMLKESEARFRQLASSLPGMVFQLRHDREGNFRFLYVSEACQTLLGLPPHEMLKSVRPFFAVLASGERTRLTAAFDEAARSGKPAFWQGVLPDGRWLELRATAQTLEESSWLWQGIIGDISHSKETEEALRRSRQQLAELSFHLETAKEEERERIARDIHDEIGSLLVRLKIEISLLGTKLPTTPVNLREAIRSIERMLNQAMETVSRVARQLRPGILKEFGLSAAIESQVEDFSRSTGISCRCQCQEVGPDIDADISLALFRIVQEALTNVAKHAQATQVILRLSRETGSIAVEICDNGRGFVEADMNKPRSFGLRGIRERVASLQGEFDFSAAPSGGACLRLRVPERRPQTGTLIEPGR